MTGAQTALTLLGGSLAGAAGGGGTGIGAMTLYQANRSQIDERVAQFRERPQIQREIEFFKKRIGEIDNIEQFFDDRRLLGTTLTAFGLEEELQFPARIEKVLTEDPSDPAALANRLVDPKFRIIADELSLHDQGLAKLKSQAFQDKLFDKFTRVEFETNLGEQNPAVREAFFFKRRIDDVEDIFDLLGDRTLRKVTLEAVGLPPQIANQSVDKQKALVAERIDLDELKTEAGIDRFLRRFLIQADTAAQTAQLSGASAASQTLGGGAGLLNLIV